MASTCKIVLGVLMAYADYMILVINTLRNGRTDLSMELTLSKTAI